MLLGAIYSFRSFSSCREVFVTNFVALFIIFVLFPATLAASETIEISGLHFAVDEIAVVDETSARVNLFGSSRIVPLSHLSEFVLDRYLEDFNRFNEFQPHNLARFLRSRLEGGKTRSTAAALHGIFHNSRRDIDHSLTLIRGLEKAEPEIHREVFREVLLRYDGSNFVEEYALIVLLLGISDYEWVRQHSTSLIYSHTSALRKIIDDEFLSAALNLDMLKASGIVDFARLFFGEEDSQTADLRALLAQLRDIAAAARSDNFEALLPFVNARADAGYQRVLLPVITDLLHRFASSELSRSNPEKAISVLSRVDFEKRTPETHRLLLESLKSVGPSPNLFIRETGTRESLLKFASRDNEINRQLSEVLTRQFRFSLQILNGEGADALLDSIVSIRPDPDSSNDLLRSEYAYWLFQNGQPVRGRAVLAGVQTGVPFTLRLKIWLNSSPVRGESLLYILLAITSVLAILYLREKRAKPTSSRPKEKTASVEEEEPSSHKGFFVNARSALWNLNPALQEYNRSLAILGLSPGVNMKDIKAAYRNAVKESHPDSNNANELTASARFIEITSAYERIVELDRAHGFAGRSKPRGEWEE